jgi:hypothetical protein
MGQHFAVTRREHVQSRDRASARVGGRWIANWAINRRVTDGAKNASTSATWRTP